jgi:hypothetical protein
VVEIGWTFGRPWWGLGRVQRALLLSRALVH